MSNAFHATIGSIDVRVGAVEIQDHTTNDRVHVTALGELLITGAVTLSNSVVDDTTVFVPDTDVLIPIAMANTADVLGAGEYGVPKITIERHQLIGIFDAAENRMPTMDTQARPGFVTITDGANEVDIIGAILSLKTDLSSVAGTVTVTGGVAGLQAIAGNIAHDTADTANPVKIGGRYDSPLPADVTNGDRTNIQTNAKGRIELASHDRVTQTDATLVQNQHSKSTSARITFLNTVVADTYSSITDNMMNYKYWHIHVEAIVAGGAGSGEIIIESQINGAANWDEYEIWTIPAAIATHTHTFTIDRPLDRIRLHCDTPVNATVTVMGMGRGL